jgi:primosomal protein N' (replication factor Y)
LINIMNIKELIVQVAVPAPLRTTFDYLPPVNVKITSLSIGTRVRVNFNRRTVVGLITGGSSRSRVKQNQLKHIIEVLDSEPILDQHMLELIHWASSYYHHPIGEVLDTILPKRLRQGHAAEITGKPAWVITKPGKQTSFETLKRAPQQASLLKLLHDNPEGLTATQLNRIQDSWRRPMQRLLHKELAAQVQLPCLKSPSAPYQAPPPLNCYQRSAACSVIKHIHEFAPFLLEGVTGSGKTEVYLELVRAVLSRQRQALVLVPEIGLTPQLLGRFYSRFSVPLAVFHSGLGDTERHCAWHMARKGLAPIVIGTRSAVFTQLARPGIIIVDEEHDTSFKQQDGFRYNARDVSVYRARRYQIPVVLGSATPSLESLYNAQQHKYRYLKLPVRAGTAKAPNLEVIDVRRLPLEDGLSPKLLDHIRQHLNREEQVMVFLNRRGFAPVLICHQCGWAAICNRCDAHMTLHTDDQPLRCHHCGAERQPPQHCPNCGSTDLRGFGTGTERVEQALRHHFPKTSIIRVDRDTTRCRGAIQSKLKAIHRGEHRILIGTQMLSKGHDFPEVTLVGIVSADHGLYSTDFRATERMAQLLIQVAGRAGRGGKPGKVLLQTYQPSNPLLQTLFNEGYTAFGAAALGDRKNAKLPPYSHMAVFRAEAIDKTVPLAFLNALRVAYVKLQNVESLTLLGPAPAPMERRAGRYRAHLLLSSKHRGTLKVMLDTLIPLIDALPQARKVRWSLDVDPIDLY